MAAKKRVEVISLRPHVERCRRATDERYMVKPERVPVLVRLGYAKPYAEAEAEAKATEESFVKAVIAADAKENAELAALNLDELMVRWEQTGLRLSPVDYLQRYPDKEHSKLARFITDKLAEGTEPENTQDEAT